MVEEGNWAGPRTSHHALAQAHVRRAKPRRVRVQQQAQIRKHTRMVHKRGDCPAKTQRGRVYLTRETTGRRRMDMCDGWRRGYRCAQGDPDGAQVPEHWQPRWALWLWASRAMRNVLGSTAGVAQAEASGCALSTSAAKRALLYARPLPLLRRLRGGAASAAASAVRPPRRPGCACCVASVHTFSGGTGACAGSGSADDEGVGPGSAGYEDAARARPVVSTTAGPSA